MVTRNLTGQPISTLTANALEQSKIGVKIEEGLGGNWQAIGKLEAGFDPATGEITDGCISIIQNGARVFSQQSSNSDSGRCGQAFNSLAWGGVSNPTYGTLTAGRQASLQLEAIGAYDPMSLSYAFSVLGFSGANAGVGSTQAARWDNSVKYVFEYGPFHAAGMYSNGGDGTGLFGEGLGANAGVKYLGFSIDAVYTQEHSAVNLASAANDPFPTSLNYGRLAANISDNEGWAVMGKYTFEFGGGLKDQGCGGSKDAPCPSPDTLTVFAGYTHTEQSNPSDPIHFGDVAGGYPLLIAGRFPDNNAFTTPKILQFYWTGAKYVLPPGWSFTGAYYHIDQNSYVADNAGCTAGGASAITCAGSFDQGSFLVDYAFNKHFDVYAGVTYGIVNDGLAAGFSGTAGTTNTCGPASNLPCRATGTATSVDTAAFVTGMRLKF